MERMEQMELTRDLEGASELSGADPVSEAGEQLEMDTFTEQGQSEAREAEQREMDQAGKLGYSSSYYEHEMARALESGNRIAYDNARRNWANAKVKEST